VLPGNTADKTTLRGFLERIERQYGKARRVWLMDRGVPTEEVLAEMRAADPPVHYFGGHAEGSLDAFGKASNRQAVARGATRRPEPAPAKAGVKLLTQQGELYVLAQSRDRVAKERAMRRRQLKRLWARLKQLSTMEISREELLMKLGAARDQSRSTWRLAVIEVAADSATLSYRLDCNKLRQARSRRPISVAHRPRRGRPGQAVEPLSAAGCGRGGIPEPQRRSRGAAGLSPARGPRRGARLHRLPGQLPARHSRAALACAGTGIDVAQCPGEVCRDERQWGTVREDYRENGDAWNYFTHDQARSRAYHWGEDGLAGFSDDHQRLCFAVALWNGKDPLLKERLFGLTNSEGNHGEDVKEYYFYLDSTPTHSYMKYLYKYPQNAYPYSDLIETNRRRGRNDWEYELLDTGVFNDDRYFDVFVEYAKSTPTIS
jgi:hypothetical protein